MFQKKGVPEPVATMPNSFFEDPEEGLWRTCVEGDLCHPEGEGERHKRESRRLKIGNSFRVCTNIKMKVDGNTDSIVWPLLGAVFRCSGYAKCIAGHQASAGG
jgi:hypothetical protein